MFINFFITVAIFIFNFTIHFDTKIFPEKFSTFDISSQIGPSRENSTPFVFLFKSTVTPTANILL